MDEKRPTLHIIATADWCATVAARWVALARAAIAARGVFHVALAGGSTPRRLYATLTTSPWCTAVDWQRVHIWFGDERSVPPEEADSNYRMAYETLLQPLSIAAAQVHRMHAEGPDPALSAAAYANELASAGALPLDLIMLGLGTDGHICSLFPETPILDVRDRPVAAVYVPRLATWRVSLTYPALDHARYLMALVCGADKAAIVRQVWAAAPEFPPGPTAAPIYPVQRIAPQGGYEVFLDTAAASNLTTEDSR